MMDDLYKSCRWCHWYKGGKCYNNKTFMNSNDTDIVYLSENGLISEAIREGFTENPFSNLRQNLESKLSKKKATEFMNDFYDELESAQLDWTEEIDESVTATIQNAINQDSYSSASEIVDPDDFYCKYFRW